MTKFEIGKCYRLIAAYALAAPAIFKVLARTENTVTLEDQTMNQVIRRRIDKKESGRNGYEVINPEGRHSMSPQLWAIKTYNS